jgi:Inner centromere protein, ARK binding region
VKVICWNFYRKMKELFSSIQSSLKGEDQGKSYRSILQQAERDFNVIEYSTDRKSLWTVGLEQYALPKLESEPVNVRSIQDACSRLDKPFPAYHTRTFDAPKTPANIKPVFSQVTLSQPVVPGTPKPLLEHVSAAAGAVIAQAGKVRDMLSIWSGHISSHKEKAFRGNTPIKYAEGTSAGGLSNLIHSGDEAHPSILPQKLDFFDQITSSVAEHIKTPSKPVGQVPMQTPLSCDVTPVIVGRRSCAFPDNRRPKLLAIPPTRPDDNYELSGKDTDSEEDDAEVEKKRAAKKVPEWTKSWREKALAQSTVDPESIFGIVLPSCDLNIIFTEENYSKMKLERPKRLRGSSGNWRMDKLKQDEIDEYRKKCGQVIKAEGVFVN